MAGQSSLDLDIARIVADTDSALRAEVVAAAGGGEATPVAWASIPDVPAALTAAQAAGTASIRALGTTATTAKAGNYAPSATEVGTALKAKTQIAALAAIATPDATDEATAITLANATKVSVNAIIAALKA